MKAVPVSYDSVQEAFRQSNSTQENFDSVREDKSYVSECTKNQSFSKEQVFAILETHSSWESSARMRAVNVLQQLPQLVSPDDDPLPAFTERELHEGKLNDPVLSRVLHFVERG